MRIIKGIALQSDAFSDKDRRAQHLWQLQHPESKFSIIRANRILHINGAGAYEQYIKSLERSEHGKMSAFHLDRSESYERIDPKAELHRKAFHLHQSQMSKSTPRSSP